MADEDYLTFICWLNTLHKRAPPPPNVLITSPRPSRTQRKTGGSGRQWTLRGVP